MKQTKLRTRPEVSRAIKLVRCALNEAKIRHVEEIDEIYHDLCACVAYDKSGYKNAGIIGWDDDKKEVVFFALNPTSVNHNDLEGVSEDEAKEWWDTQNVENFVLNLRGDVRKILAKHRVAKLA